MSRPFCFLILFGVLQGATACTYELAIPAQRPQKTISFSLSNSGTGTLSCQAPAECPEIPYRGDCDEVLIEVDPATAQTCQACAMSDGQQSEPQCGEGIITCVLVTLPEPDCVVCAHESGAVVFSSCERDVREECTTEQRADGVICERCFDPHGRVIYDSCAPACRGVVCPPIDCGPNSEPLRLAGDCCPRCVAQDRCDATVCAMDYPVPQCPPDAMLIRNPEDCCSYMCTPLNCPPEPALDGGQVAGCVSNADCPPDAACVDGICSMQEGCPPGFVRSGEYPHCGQCIPDPEQRFCLDGSDCLDGEYCAFDGGSCLATDESGPELEGPGCYGVCRPNDDVCYEAPRETTLPACEGEWLLLTETNGCPVPTCVCPDGSVTLTGTCRDLCADVACTDVELSCPSGFVPSYGYPYCCGVCVPENLCSFYEAGGFPADSESSGEPLYGCPEVECAAGYYQELDQETCCPKCVAPMGESTCLANADCVQGYVCNLDQPVCATSEECETPDSPDCAELCHGVCEPSLTGSVCRDSDGFAPDVNGYVKIETAGGVVDGAEEDYCKSTTTVVEHYCYQASNGPSVAAVDIECVNGCMDGRCKP